MTKLKLPLPRFDTDDLNSGVEVALDKDVTTLERCYALAAARVEAAEALWGATADARVYSHAPQVLRRQQDCYAAWVAARDAHLRAVEGDGE